MRTDPSRHGLLTFEALEKREVFDTSLAGIPREILDTGADIQSAVQADFNGDGRTDVALASGRDLLLLYASPSGGFAAPVTLRLGVDVGKLAIARLNGDSRPDLVALGGAVEGGQRSVLRALINNRNGRFTLADRAFIPSDGTVDATITAHNIVGDPRSEIFVTTVADLTGTMRMFRFGPGGFTQGQVLSTSGAAFVQPVFYDFDGDGDDDIITARNDPARGPQVGRVVGLALTGDAIPVLEAELATRDGRIDSLLFGNLGDGRGNLLLISFTERDRQTSFFSLPGDSAIHAINPGGQGAALEFDELARFAGGEAFIFGTAIERRVHLLNLRDVNSDGKVDVIAESRLNAPPPTDASASTFTPTYRESSLVQLLGGPRDRDGRMVTVESHSVGGAGESRRQYAPRYLVGQFAGNDAADLIVLRGDTASISRGNSNFKPPVISRIQSADILPAVVGAFGFKVKGVFDPDEVRGVLTRGRVQSVHAYFDSNNNGRIDTGDRLLAIDQDGADGWNFGGVFDPRETARSFLIVAYDDRGAASRVTAYPTNVPRSIDLTPLL